MKKLGFLVLFPVLLSACSTQYLDSSELRALKPGCANGDTSVCAQIGHKIRIERAEAAYLATHQ